MYSGLLSLFPVFLVLTLNCTELLPSTCNPSSSSLSADLSCSQIQAEMPF